LVDGEVGAFEASRALFGEMVGWLAAPETGRISHEELEERVAGRGRELLRRLFQDHADLRAAREERREEVVGVDAVARTRVEGGHSRGLATVFGSVDIERFAYRASGSVNLYPADEAWNLPGGLHSHGLRRLVAIETPRGSFESAQAAIERTTGVRVGKRQVEDTAVAAALDIAAFYSARRPDPVDDEQLLVITCDGKGVVMRPDGLRPGTAKAAATRGPKIATRTSPGEKRNRKRMAELACVYDATPAPRAVSDIITTGKSENSGGGGDSRRREGPRATGKWLTGSIVDDITTVISAAFDEADRRDPPHARTWVALVDGNNTQIEAITTEATRRGVTVTILIDFIHVAEYVWKAAWSFFTPGDPDAEAWVADKLIKVLNGNARDVAAGIRRRATMFNFRDRERAGADSCADYLTNKNEYLCYDKALTAGWPIATGIIEAACRYLVKDRLDITGARWGLAGAEAILLLRALHSNDDFTDYWTYHLRQERRRNHHAHYQQPHGDYQRAA
jgi:hypothetical protein